MSAQKKVPAPRQGQAPRQSVDLARHHHSAKQDLALLMEPVARELLGEPNKALSKKGELRFGTHGSLAVNLEEGDWYSHEEEVGGGVLDLIKRETGLATRHEQLTWLEERGLREKSEPPRPPTKADEVARYRYNDAKGRPRFYVVRYEPQGQPKTFRQGRLDDRGRFAPGVKGIDTRIPYHLDKLVAQPEQEVYLVEGEKHVHALEELGLLATTNAGGAGKWTDEHSRHLAGRRVVILPDNDAPGIAHARKAQASLEAAGAEVKVVMLPGLPEKGDVIDWLDAGGTLEHLLEIVDQGGETLPEEPGELTPRVAAVGLGEFLARDIPPREMLLAPWLPKSGLAIGVASGYEVAAPGSLSIITPDMQPDFRPMPDLSTPEGQLLLEPHADDADLIVVDNIATLCRSGKENEGESWLAVQGWALRMRAMGKSVLFVHHAGKGGQQRGTSRREDVLDTVIALKYAKGDDSPQGARFELHFEKNRGFYGDEAKAREVSLVSDEKGNTVWGWQHLNDSTFDRVVDLLNEGLSQKEVATELEINKGTVSKYARKAKESGLLTSDKGGK